MTRMSSRSWGPRAITTAMTSRSRTQPRSSKQQHRSGPERNHNAGALAVVVAVITGLSWINRRAAPPPCSLGLAGEWRARRDFGTGILRPLAGVLSRRDRAPATNQGHHHRRRADRPV